jgi:hypothetical protein
MDNRNIKWIAEKKCYRIKESWITPRTMTLMAVGLLGLFVFNVIGFVIKEPDPVVNFVLSTAAWLFLIAFFVPTLIGSGNQRIEVSKEWITFGRWKKRRYDAHLPHRFEITPLKAWLKFPVVKLTFYAGEAQENFTLINTARQAETFVETFEAAEDAVKTGNPTLGRRNATYYFGRLKRLSLNGRVRTHFLPYAQSYTVDMVYVTPFGRMYSLFAPSLVAIAIIRESMGWRPDIDFIKSDVGLIIFDIVYMRFAVMLLKLLITPAKQMDISKHKIRFRERNRILAEYDAALPHRFEAVPLPPPHPTRWHKHAMRMGVTLILSKHSKIR